MSTERKDVTLSAKSSTIARNTVVLYLRMFFLMVISLFTARIVFNALGVENKGIYGAVASFVSMMAVVTSSLSSAISRFITVGIGKGDKEDLKRIFATANGLLILTAFILLVIAEPLGMWYISNKMNLPDGRAGAACWVFQFSLLSALVSLVSIPYNATIFAHEKMGIYGIIGVIEGVCKLLVAFLITISPFDTLIFYSLLLCLISLMVRFMYTSYCRRHFEESRAGYSLDRKYLGQLAGFAGWNGLSSGVLILNTQGLTLLLNYFFGVVFNAMRDIANNVEGMVKPFVMNVLTSIVPQITKSYAAGDKDYSFNLACKGCKYGFLIIFVLAVPFWFDAEFILDFWLGGKVLVPDGSGLFTRLMLVCLLIDLMVTPLSNVVLASGRIRKFYLYTSAVNALVFPLTWIAYRIGAPAYSCYLVFIVIYFVCDIIRLVLVRNLLGFPMKMFYKEVLLKVIPVVVLTLVPVWLVWRMTPEGWARLIAVLFIGTGVAALTTYFFALTEGERGFVDTKFRQAWRLLRKSEKREETLR